MDTKKSTFKIATDDASKALEDFGTMSFTPKDRLEFRKKLQWIVYNILKYSNTLRNDAVIDGKETGLVNDTIIAIEWQEDMTQWTKTIRQIRSTLSMINLEFLENLDARLRAIDHCVGLETVGSLLIGPNGVSASTLFTYCVELKWCLDTYEKSIEKIHQ